MVICSVDKTHPEELILPGLDRVPPGLKIKRNNKDEEDEEDEVEYEIMKKHKTEHEGK